MAELLTGITDRPARRSEDLLGLQQYGDALTQFILSCETPITIGVQGDWGAGKTSLMEMVQETLLERGPSLGYCVHCVWFNTWMYSQFSAGDRLPLLMLSALIGKLPHEGKGYDLAVKYLGTLGKLAVGLAAKQLAGMDLELTNTQPAITGEMLEELRSKFVEIIKIHCAGHDHSRVVFFVDDLDRLLPERAVELMEVMKIFLDAPNVVFVLACDYPVVAKGIRAKFHLTEADSYEERSFFDKIIQVPFRMPLHAYNLDAYVRALLEKIGWNVPSAEIAEYRGLLETSVGFNPRTIKRLFNTTLLLTTLLKAQNPEILAKDYVKKQLFAVQCMEMKYPSLHTYLARDPARVMMLRDEQSVDGLSTAPEAQYEEKLQPQPGFGQFTALFYKLVDRDKSGQLSDEEVQEMNVIFGLTRITAVEEEPPLDGRMNQEAKAEEFFVNLRQSVSAEREEQTRRFVDRELPYVEGRFYKEGDRFSFRVRLWAPRVREPVTPFSLYDDGSLMINLRQLRNDDREWVARASDSIVKWLDAEELREAAGKKQHWLAAELVNAKWESFDSLVRILGSSASRPT